MNSPSLTFGPIPSRRLGRSLGINNIPPKVCTYSCIYCQVGRTSRFQVERGEFYNPEDISKSVKSRVKKIREKGERIDFLTFVPDGEPTLDKNLGVEIELLKPLGIKIAVISNGSLIWDESVVNDLMMTDWVSLKVDAVSDDIWRRINRPHKALNHQSVLEGIIAFSGNYDGEIATETMLIEGVNESIEEIEKIACFIKDVSPSTAYISIPTRPPAESYVRPADEEKINLAFQTFKEAGINTECIIGFEGTEFGHTGDVVEDLLSILSVHPMRRDAVEEFLRKVGAVWEVVDELLEEERIREVEYQNSRFYIRTIK